MMKSRMLLCLLAMAFCLSSQGQMMNPVRFTSQLKVVGNGEGELVFDGTIADGWHVYSTDLGSGGPVSATLNVVKVQGMELVGKLRPRTKEVRHFDKLFGMEVRYMEKRATFVQKVRFTQPRYTLDCYLEYGACNDEMCLPPSQVELKKSGTSPALPTQQPATTQQPSSTPQQPSADTASTAPSPQDAHPAHPAQDSLAALSPLWSPVVSELRAFGGASDIAAGSPLYILFLGFVGGLLAVLMPCIWPVIPMTVSFFLKRAKADGRRGVRDALVYGLSIIVIYLSLGLLVTAAFGSDALNAMSTNAVFNVFLFLLLVVFALSFFGWFEIRLPSSWADTMDSKADRLSSAGSSLSAYLSIFFMAFTLVLVSFSCTAPIIGLLLVETTTTGNWLAPAIGMFGFALALALPFTLFALFPSWLKQAPKSGAWMNTLKVVLGFIELAFSLKFLSVADLAYGWHLLSRDVFLALWIAIFALLGAYLCGWLRFPHDEGEGQGSPRPMPVACIMGGLLSLAFAVYLLPGLWGAPCKLVSAFAPPMNTQEFNLNSRVVEAQYTDYETGMAAARAEGKPVLLDFTGYGCVNCRKMEAAVWTDGRVADRLKNDYVLISLYVDDKTPLDKPLVVTDADGNTKTLRTVGAKWSYLQSHKFGANAQPFYVILDSQGKPLAAPHAYDEDVDAYLDFLAKGLKN